MERENIILTVGHQSHRGFIVSIETITRRGIFQFDIIGLANKTISESKQRILSAISFSLQEKRHYINKKITTLLSPADLKKEGSHFDLPIAVSYLISVKKLLPAELNTSNHLFDVFSKTIILGELTLTGSVLPIKQISPLLYTAINQGIRHFILPLENKSDTKNIKDIHIWYVKHISEITDILLTNPNSILQKFEMILEKDNGFLPKKEKNYNQENKYLIDLIEGNTVAKRALEIALAGKHHLLLIGTPGSGKSLLAKASSELIPELDMSEANVFQKQRISQENTGSSELNIYTQNCIHFRQPHHTSNYSEIIGNRFLPGEIVLAHRGILFLDELVEFNRRALEALRQPMENKYIQKNYSNESIGESYSIIPTDFILIGCMNPCDCGYFKSDQKKCVCAQNQLDKYKRKMNSPLFQRFDLCVYIQGDNKNKRYENARDDKNEQRVSGKSIKDNIEKVRLTQKNIQVRNLDLLDTEDAVRSLFEEICIKHKFSKREENSLLKVTRTIADLAESTRIKKEHLLEAISYKTKLNTN